MEKLKDLLENSDLKRRENWERIEDSIRCPDFYERFSNELVNLLENLKEKQYGIKVVYTKSIQKILSSVVNEGIDAKTADLFMVQYFIPEAAKSGIEIWDHGHYCFLTKNHSEFERISDKFWDFMSNFENLRTLDCNVIKVMEPIVKFDDLSEGKWYRCVHGRNSQNVRYTIDSEKGGFYSPGNGKLPEAEYQKCLFQEI